MPYKLREYDCADCGARTRRKRKSNDPWICEACGADRRRANGRRRAAQMWSRPDRQAMYPHD